MWPKLRGLEVEVALERIALKRKLQQEFEAECGIDAYGAKIRV